MAGGVVMRDHYLDSLEVLQGHIAKLMQPEVLDELWGDGETICPVVLPWDTVPQVPNYVQLWAMPTEPTTTVYATGREYELEFNIVARIYIVNSNRARANVSLRRIAYTLAGIISADPMLSRTAYDVRPRIDAPELGYDDAKLCYAATTVTYEIRVHADFDGLAQALADESEGE